MLLVFEPVLVQKCGPRNFGIFFFFGVLFFLSCENKTPFMSLSKIVIRLVALVPPARVPSLPPGQPHHFPFPAPS